MMERCVYFRFVGFEKYLEKRLDSGSYKSKNVRCGDQKSC